MSETPHDFFTVEVYHFASSVDCAPIVLVIEAWVVQLARDNRSWDYRQIGDALLRLAGAIAMEIPFNLDPVCIPALELIADGESRVPVAPNWGGRLAQFSRQNAVKLAA